MESRNFGYFLRMKRKALGLSQADVADRTKVQRTSISRLESINGNPQWSMIRLLAEKGLGVSVADLFEIAPKEARQPVIHVEGQSPAPKMGALMLKTQAKPVPVVASESPMRSKVISEQDIIGYCAIDDALLKDHRLKNLVIWVCHETGISCDWLLVDINDTRLQNGELFLVDLDGRAQARRSWLTDRGALVLDSMENNGVQPVAFWGRQKERVEVLGRIVMVCRTLGTTVAA